MEYCEGVKKIIAETYLAKWLYIGVPLISVFLIDGSVTDPVNTPKLFLLGVVASGAFAVLISSNLKSLLTGKRSIVFILSLFLIFSLSSLFFSNSPMSQSLYGVYGRNNGFLTYLFLVLLFIAAMILSEKKNFLRIALGLLAAGLVNLLYCSWVLLFGDFLSWSNPYGNILGTFGNPNFIGSFFGMCVGVLLTFIISPNTPRNFKLLLALFVPVTLVLIYMSRAIQGRVLASLGFFIVIFFWLRFSRFNRLFLWAYSIFGLVVGSLSLMGALQSGPLASVIYKTSVSLRGQYWISGWNTGLANPWNGAGFDSLGDWYRRMRDSRALELPGVDTVVNTAHNVPLDIFAFGGWPLFVTYIALFGLVGIESAKYIYRLRHFDPIFISLFVAWLSYQVQSLISINQIGLAVWGWTLSGALIGYLKTAHVIDSKRATITKPEKRQDIFTPQLISGVAVVFGGLLSVPPLASDIQWMTAQKSNTSNMLEDSMRVTYLNPVNSYKYLVNVQIFERSGLHELAHKYAKEAVRYNPDYFDSWRLLYVLKASSQEDKSNALKNMQRLDPKNSGLK